MQLCCPFTAILLVIAVYLETCLPLAHILSPHFISHGVVTLLLHVCWVKQALDYRKQPHWLNISAIQFTKVS